MAKVAGRFARVEPRATARVFVAGLLSDVERKNCWSLGEHCGHRRPDAMQRLLRSARWDADAVRDDLRDLVVERLGHPDGVLIVDETGFLKKGEHSAGVQRQYSGTAGRIENSQIGVFLAYASGRGRALIDRRLYLPRDSWCADGPRRAAAGIPEQATFATKPYLARDMIAAALDAGTPARWVTGDEVYGQDPSLRAELEARGTGYVLAVSCATRVRFNDGRTPVRADTASASLPESAWQTRSAGAGAKGPRTYQWAWIALDGDGSRPQLLVRRNIATDERAFYLCFTPQPTPLSTLVRVAGVRWSIEECFQAAKGQVGLDHYQVRHFTSWHRHITLAMLALGVLAFLVAEATTTPTGPGHLPIDLTANEIRHLMNALIFDQPRSPAQVLHWSIWRRMHQGRARHSHYQRRLAT
ncbi:IS701 family transposase [Streptomyces sp. NBC_00144]|uniref:IS701 family transposase n=1 Tax=Streptomyces sp. NBC_00144 TaxID=2975665 RepID=UPI003243543B